MSIRLKTKVGEDSDKYLKLKLEQDFDFIEILSLNITQEDAYTKFCSDYGVVVGRVTVNGYGYGVPNAKVSIFIPIDEVDKNDSRIKGLYPFEVVSDKNSDGLRYNLLHKESQSNNDCFTPIGNFPTKREVLDDEVMMGIYCKYYKFTTTTNHAGDFMIFGVPTGNHTLHIDTDISDIGEISQRPYDLIRQGAPTKMFESSTKFKANKNIDRLPQVKTFNIGVNVQPFWGDLEACEIGITRMDVDLNYEVVPTAIFVGSIFGDQDKFSVNKRCRPRGSVGEICEQVTAAGSIEILRKNIDNEIELFSVDGGRNIEDDGSWAFQIPMNLDYMVTAEDGSLILSNDPNVGIPTRASVRFRIKMDEDGGEDSKSRSRASYLVPNNPKLINEVDYEFGSKTKDTSFKDIHWNKIYTISNFIPRFGRDFSGLVPGINSTGIKNVDECSGEKNPFPFNRVKTTTNPIFFIICLIIKIIGFLVWLINYFIIPLINAIVDVINFFIDLINGFPFYVDIDELAYVPCVTVVCGTDDGDVYYAPGCSEDDGGFEAANPQPTRYCGDIFDHTCDFGSDVGWSDCIAFQLSKTLGLFQYDFYNDWVNGTLYSYLLRYNKKLKGREEFCEYDCEDFISDPNYSGVDNNRNGEPDNSCYDNMLIDVLFNNSSSSNTQDEYRFYRPFRDGLIKKYDGHLYYAATLHDLSNKLFATDIVCLGSVLECDWQGLPKLQQNLITTTYKLPPDVAEVVQTSSGDNAIMASGIVYEGGNTRGDFFSVNCLGLHVDGTQAMNIRHICELGVNLDEVLLNPITGVIDKEADGIIGVDEIDSGNSKESRDIFYIFNKDSKFPITPVNLSGIDTNFNKNNRLGFYDFATSTLENGSEYINFRGIKNSNDYSQPEHSFYFYFGMEPGKSAIDKMNQRYFAPCSTIKNNLIEISYEKTNSLSTAPTGSIKFVVIGGSGPYKFTITNNGTVLSTGILLTNPSNKKQSLPLNIFPLGIGSYVISIIDASGNKATETIIINGPFSIFCNASVTKTCTSLGSKDGEITVNVGGGSGPISFTLKDSFGSLVGIPSNGIVTSSPFIIKGLDVNKNKGYTLSVTDGTNTCTKTGITINGTTKMVVNITKKDNICGGAKDGNIKIKIDGGTPPFTATTTGPNNFKSNYLNLTGLRSGVYITTVIDSSAPQQTFNQSNVINDLNQKIDFDIVSAIIGGQYFHNISTNQKDANGNSTYGGKPPYTATTNTGVVYTFNSMSGQNVTKDNNSTATIVLNDSIGCKKRRTG